jgi:hypothetical protein
MYLPRSLPLCPPHVATWVGGSGKRYDFAVARLGTICIDEPAVYVLARHEANETTALYVGQTSSLHRHFGLSRDRCPEDLRRALAMRMTHVHVRFDACSKATRQAEVRDLVAALRPALNEPTGQEEEETGLSFAMAAQEGIGPGSASPSARDPSQYNRFALEQKRAEVRSFSADPVDGESISWARRPFASEPPFRADPAREEDGDPGEMGLAEDRTGMLAPPLAVNALAVPAAPSHVEHGGCAQGERAEVLPVARHAYEAILPKLSSLLGRVLAHARRPRAGRPFTSGGEAASEVPGTVSGSFERATPDDAATEPKVSTTQAPSEGVACVPHLAPDISSHVSMLDSVAAPGDQPAEGEATQSTDAPSVPPSLPATEPCNSQASHRPDLPPAACEPRATGKEEAKRRLDLHIAAPVVLFAGELSYDSGTDILMDAIVTVCGGNRDALFLFAGEGPMRIELQAYASRAGIAQRCRFLGDVASEAFGDVLAVCDFVVIPARKPQGEELARTAIANGKPVLTTHQASIGAVLHGHNGLVTYDNPGSLVWGIRELLGPLYVDLRKRLSEEV